MTGTPPRKQQLTGPEGAVLHGNGVQLAQQLRDKVLHPLLVSVNSDQGIREVLSLQTCLLLQVMADIRSTHGQQMVDVILTEAQLALDNVTPMERH